jgi:hypothetical protein
MCTMLFVLCIDPLLGVLEQNLRGMRIGKRARKTVLVAYADDFTIFVTTAADLPVIQETIVL